MDYEFIDKHQLDLTWLEDDIYEIFCGIIREKRDAFFALTVDFDLPESIRNDARERGKHLENFLSQCETAKRYINNSQDMLK